ncbi:MAG TPA: hypothetical protein VF153_03970 [Candidatus Limnocylindria bacterium]
MPADAGAGATEAAQARRLEDVRGLIREQRRTTMRARTIAITLDSALTEFTANREANELTDLQRIELRRQWCQRALGMIQEVRAHAMRTSQAFELVAAEGGLARSMPARFAAANRQIAQYADQAERSAIAGIG